MCMDFSLIHSVSIDSSSTHPLRILTLGDGNLSFSHLLLQSFVTPRKKRLSTKRHILHNRSVAIVCSVYDNQTTQNIKYHNSHHYEHNILLYGGVVGYNIDGTDIQRTLCAEFANGDILDRTINIQLQQSGTEQHKIKLINNLQQQYNHIIYNNQYEFDVIIFNHPHSGSEDVIRHQQLLAHFLYSAKQLLPHDTNTIYVCVTLCNNQPHTWLLDRSIELHGYKIERYYTFDARSMPQWEQKRHHTAKQFTNKVNSEMNSNTSEVQHCYWLKFSLDPNCQSSKTHNTLSVNSLYCDICDTLFASVAELSNHWSALQPNQYTPQQYQCTICGKQYADQRSYQQHIQYAQHKNNVTTVFNQI